MHIKAFDDRALPGPTGEAYREVPRLQDLRGPLRDRKWRAGKDKRGGLMK